MNKKILILFYSMYGHGVPMVEAAKEGIMETGVDAEIKQTEEIIPERKWNERMKDAKKEMEKYPVAKPKEDLYGIDGLLLYTPTRYGNMITQMRNFWDQTSEVWTKGGLIGKPASVMSSSATQHGGQETTLITTIITLLHQGCIIVGLPYSNTEQMTLDEITGGSPYGASTITGGMGERMPSNNELILAKAQGKYLAEIAKKL